MSNGYTFNYRWFDYQKPVHIKFMEEFGDKEILVLEIGAFEGLSTTFFLDNYNSRVLSIDPFITKDTTTPVLKETIDIFNKNISICKRGENHILYRKFSHDALPRLLMNETEFDYILVDGSHMAGDVLTDAIYSFHLVKKGGYIFFDDYQYSLRVENGDKMDKPTKGIDTFLSLYKDQIEIKHIGYHLVIQKK